MLAGLLRYMPVITLSENDFKTQCTHLASIILKDFSPELVVSIPHGGAIVYANMIDVEGFSQDSAVFRVSRPFTATKKKLRVGFVFKNLPYFVLDNFRRLESYGREIMHELCSGRKISPVKPEVMNLECAGRYKRIIIIDDSVDSGTTMALAYQAVSERFPYAEIKTAAISVTFRRPIMQPDFYIFKNSLIRFPWSEDYKGRS